MPNRIGNFESTMAAFNARQTSPLGYAPSDIGGLTRWGILNPNGQYTNVLAGKTDANKVAINAEDVRNFLNWAVVGDVNTAYPPIVNLLLCLKYKRIEKAIKSTGLADAARTNLKKLNTDIHRLLVLGQKYPLSDNQVCQKVSPNFNPTEVKLKAQQMSKDQKPGGTGCYQKCGDVYIYGSVGQLGKDGGKVLQVLSAPETGANPTAPVAGVQGQQPAVGPVGPAAVVASAPAVSPSISPRTNSQNNPTPVMPKNVPPPHTQAELNAAKEQWKKNLEKKPNQSPSAPGNNTPNWVKQGLKKNAEPVDIDEPLPQPLNIPPPPTEEELDAAKKKWKKNLEKKPNESPFKPGNNTSDWAEEGRKKNTEQAKPNVNKANANKGNVNNPPLFGNFTRKSPFTKGSNQIRLNGSNNKAFSYNNPMWNKTRRHGKQTSANRNAANKVVANAKAAANKAAANKAAADKAAANAKAAANKAAANAERAAEENRTRRQNAARSGRDKLRRGIQTARNRAAANAQAAADKAAANKAASNKAAANAKVAAERAAEENRTRRQNAARSGRNKLRQGVQTARNKAAANAKAAADKAAANKAASNKAAANAERAAEENRTRRQNAARSGRDKLRQGVQTARNKAAANAKAAADKAAANAQAAAEKAAANKAAADKATANAKAAAERAAQENIIRRRNVARSGRNKLRRAATSARNKEEAKAKAIADKAVANAKAAANKAAANKAAANKAAANAKAAANTARANQLAKTQKAKNTLMKRVTGTRKLRPANNFTGPMTPPETPRNNTPPPNSPPNSPPPTPSNTTGLARTWGQAKKFPQRKPSNENSNNGRSRASTLGALPENINRRSSNILELEDQGTTRRTLGANASTRRGFGPTSTKPPAGVGRNASNTLGFSPGEMSRQVKEQQARRKAAQTTNEARPLPALPKAQRRPLGLGFGVNGPTSRLPSMAPSSRGFGVTQPPIAVARAINAAIPAPRKEEARPLPSLPPVVRLPKRAVLGSEYDRTPAPRSSLESMAASSRGLGGLAPVVRPLRSAPRDPAPGDPAPAPVSNVRPLPPAPPVAPARTMNTGPNVRPLPATPLPQPTITQLPTGTSSRGLWQPVKPRGSPPTRKLSRKRSSRANKSRRH